ncbi:MAG: hypothetical protein ACTSSE_01505 [Candidatus Thorarchaeota archaeon]
MESAISRQWYQLYENNPKIQAFAVAKEGAIVWQTENWDLTEDIKSIVEAPQKASGKVSAGDVKYKRVRSAKDFYIGSSGNDAGHLLIVKINDSSWAVARTESSAVPELTIIDVTKAAIHLKGNI